jgi:hypothetical protein
MRTVYRKVEAIENAGYKVIARTNAYKYNNFWTVYVAEKDGKTCLIFGDMELQRKVSEKTVQSILKREEEVSKKLWDKGVRFRDLTARRGDDWINAMEKFHTAVEADKPITLVSKEAYDKVKGEELYRGIAPMSDLRRDVTMTKTTEDCVKQLMEGGVGDCFPSRGVYGDCIAYLSNDARRTGFAYATNRGTASGGYIVRMKLKDDARKITYDDAKDLFNAINEADPNSKQPYFSKKQVSMRNGVEVGKAMQMLGYDYIYEPHGDGMNVHFYMVLNRDALVAMKDDYVEVKITDEVFRTRSW